MLRPFLVLAAVLAAAAPASAVPVSFSQGLSFATGTQSLWGPGKGTSSFGASGGASVDILGATVGAGYSASASSGTAQATLAGTLHASYDDELLKPGMTSIGVDFTGTSGSLSTSLGARFDVTGYVHDVPFYGPWDFCLYCNKYSLDPSITFAPSFGVTRSGSDSFAVAGVGPDIGVASAQLTLNANQTARIRPDALTGILTYTHRGTGTTRSLPFSMASLSFLDADLDLKGIWDFSFQQLDIANTFSSTIGANMSIDFDVSLLGSKSFPFPNISLLNTPTFDLNFAQLAPLAAFSISVPEPGTLLLVAAGLVGLARFGSRRSGS